MRSTHPHIASRARSVLPLIGRSGFRLGGLIIALLISISLSAQTTDRDLFDAYLNEDMAVWKEYIDSPSSFQLSPSTIIYEYGYCGFLVDKDKANALPYIQRFHEHVETLKDQLPPGHYEMWTSAVYVYEMAMHVSLRPVTTMNLAKEATRLAPNDPLTLSYYGTCLFYAPAPFGDKKKALQWFERAETLFSTPEWDDCWLHEANRMYITQCKEKRKRK